MKNIIQKGISMVEKAENLVIKAKVMGDQKGGPGLEEAGLLVFVGVIVVNAASSFGGTINTVFTNAMSTLTSTLGL